MDEIPLIHNEGRPYYGHGQTLCLTCWSAGKVIETVNHGYGCDALEMLEVSFLITAAEEHKKSHMDHDVRVYTFARGG